MEIVIEITNEEYEWIKRANIQTTPLNRFCVKAIANGTPLPEHGDLIDRDKLVPCCKFRGDCWADKCDSCSDYAVDYSDIKNAIPIIGAERSDKDGDSD